MKKTKRVAFKESKWGGLIFLFYLGGALSSVIPEENVRILIVNLTIATVLSLLMLLIWKIHQNDSKRYFSLASYIMMISFGFFASIPILREFIGTLYFWIIIGLLLLIILPTHLFREQMLRFILRPYKYGLFGKLFLIIPIIIGYFGSYVWVVSVAFYREVNNLGLLGSLAFFGLSTIFLFLAPIMLNKQEDVERIEKSVNS